MDNYAFAATMLAPPMRPKRARSSSPPTSPTGVSSPLDILLKRRRRDDEYGIDQSSAHDEAEFGISIAGPSIYPQPAWYEQDRVDAGGSQIHINEDIGIEKRRRRQWEKAQAPLSQNHFPNHFQPNALPPRSTDNLSPHQWYSQPQPTYHETQARRNDMSSSPIRHQMPTSSPFREKKRDQEWEDEMSIDEMRREWGDEYASQNTILHTLVCTASIRSTLFLTADN